MEDSKKEVNLDQNPLSDDPEFWGRSVKMIPEMQARALEIMGNTPEGRARFEKTYGYPPEV
jgi:hypothetical protein